MKVPITQQQSSFANSRNANKDQALLHATTIQQQPQPKANSAGVVCIAVCTAKRVCDVVSCVIGDETPLDAFECVKCASCCDVRSRGRTAHRKTKNTTV